MKKISALLLLIIAPAVYAESFFYSYTNVFQPEADTYLVGQTNAQKINEGIVKYYAPIALDTPASLTYHFALANTITSATLKAHIASYNFGAGSQGFGSLWGSKDGSSWQLLMDAPTPGGIAAGYFYDQALPEDLLGDTDIWIQARIQSSGLDIMSQFSRTDDTVPSEVFQFSAETVPEPSTYALLLLSGAGALWALKRRKS
jgi:hypothetical protein